MVVVVVGAACGDVPGVVTADDVLELKRRRFERRALVQGRILLGTLSCSDENREDIALWDGVCVVVVIDAAVIVLVIVVVRGTMCVRVSTVCLDVSVLFSTMDR